MKNKKTRHDSICYSKSSLSGYQSSTNILSQKCPLKSINPLAYFQDFRVASDRQALRKLRPSRFPSKELACKTKSSRKRSYE